MSQEPFHNTIVKMNKIEQLPMTPKASSSSSRSAQPDTQSLIITDDLSKAVAAAILAPPQQLQLTVETVPKVAQASPCESVPGYVDANSLINTGSNDFEFVRKSIGNVFNSRPEFFCFYYSSNDKSFDLHHVEGIFSSLYQITCYFDAKSSSHLLDVRNVKGRPFQSFSVSVRSLLVDKFNPSHKALSASASRRTMFELPRELVDELDAEILASGGPSRLESFLLGFDGIVALSMHHHFEMRSEGLRSICSLAIGNDKDMLCNEHCIAPLVNAITCGLKDKFEEVRESAVLAAEVLSALPVYSIALGQVDILSALVAEIRPYEASEAYLHFHTVRRAAKALLQIAPLATSSALAAFSANNISDAAAWGQLVQKLNDTVAKNLATELSAVFDAPSSSGLEFPCELVPSFIHANHFRVKEATLSAVEDRLRECFKRLPDVATSFVAKEHSFRSKVVCQSEVSIFATSIFFDNAKSEFVVEVRRLAGDGSYHNRRDFFAVVQSLYNDLDNSATETGSEPEEVTGSCPVTFNQFMVSMGHIISFARDKFADSRVEGVKMLIDSRYSRVSAEYLLQGECVSAIVGALSYLVQDANTQVQELAIIGVHAYASWRNEYAEAFLAHREATRQLLTTLSNVKLDGELFYENAPKVRSAAAALVHILGRDAVSGRSLLHDALSIDSLTAWTEFSAPLVTSDPELNVSLQRIGSVVF